MHPARYLALAATIVLASCTTPPTKAPSLAPRGAEAIDPRLPVRAFVDAQPVTPALAARLAELVAQARSGDAAFRAAAANAERIASTAGAPQSESWIVAQQALSVAVAARAATTRALGDIDESGATRLAATGAIAPADLAAIEAAAAEVGAIDRRQAEMVDTIAARLRG